MYAVIRTGGKQYRVAPGDVLQHREGRAESGQRRSSSAMCWPSLGGYTYDGPQNAKVTATVLSEGRGDKILVFHYKRKKQYKKLQGHRQAFTAVRINRIEVDGTTYWPEKQSPRGRREIF